MGILVIGFLTLLFTGCGGDKNKGIEAVFLADSSGAGIGDNDGYPDQFLTPSSIKIGVKSVKLIKANDTYTYTILDTKDSAPPLVLDLTGTAQTADINPLFPTPTDCPDPCEFSKVQMELTFFDLQISVYAATADTTSIDHRIRFYTLPPTDPDLEAVQAGDVLFGDLAAVPNFNWIDITDGRFVPLTEPRPTTPLQVPASRFPENSYSQTVKVYLPKFLSIPKDPKGLITVTITVQIGNLFFYDDTDTPPNGRFDLSTDGRLNANEPDSHFYPGFPPITASAE